MVSAGILEISTKANFSRFHCNFLATAARENRIKRDEGGEGGVGRRIASLSAVPRIRTNIFPKQLDCIESEKDRQIERIRVQEDGEGERKGRGKGTRWGRIVPRAMVPSGAGTREGMENTSYPSLRLILFVSASRIRRTLQR